MALAVLISLASLSSVFGAAVPLLRLRVLWQLLV
jgi:hypothetical protein